MENVGIIKDIDQTNKKLMSIISHKMKDYVNTMAFSFVVQSNLATLGVSLEMYKNILCDMHTVQAHKKCLTNPLN